jgi:hypothetical protein
MWFTGTVEEIMRDLRVVSSRVVLASLVLALGLSVSSCSDNTAPLAAFEPQVSKVADSFSLQATGVTDVTATVSYTWSNSGTRATINHSTTTKSGATVLVIKDAAGTTVYNKALVPSLNEPTAIGVAGNWTVQVSLTRYSGTLNMSAQKL